MNRAFLFGLLLAAAPFAHAQDGATNNGPVVMPPADLAPPAPDTNAPAATNAVPADATASTNALFAPDAQQVAPAANAPAPAMIQTSPSSNPIIQQNAPAQHQEDIDDIRPPLFFLHSWSWLWIALGVLALIALLVLVWKWFSRNPFLSAKSAYELTLEKLGKARELLREDNPVPYAVVISEIIRSYLGQRFQSPSTRRTTEEFLKLMEADPDTPLAEHRDLLRNFLQACDLVKFARYQPTLDELEQVHQRAVTFVTATKPQPEKGPVKVKEAIA